MASRESNAALDTSRAQQADVVDEKSSLDVGKLPIDKQLFRYFDPEIAAAAQMMPVAASHRRGEGRPLAEQEWLLKVGVAEQNAKEVERHADYYAEQIRDACPAFWPGRIVLSVMPTAAEEVGKRLDQIRTSWDMRVMEEGLVMPSPDADPPIDTPPTEGALEEAVRHLNSSFVEATQTTISMVAGVSMRADQIMDLRVDDRASNRRALQNVLKVAILAGASDIHFEYQTDHTNMTTIEIRLRIDGVLQPLIDTNSSLGPAILNILGKCAGIGVEESSFHMRPQDGKMIIYAPDGRRFDGRLAFTPVPVTSQSFNCVLRLLDSTRAFEFDKLDMSPRNKDALKWALGLDHGMVVLTGPTGSGKSSTIQACLRKVINPELKVITIEDPVEYFLKGAEHTQVNSKDPEMSFANLLRSALRRDPDVIFLGEVRDEETAEVAVKAALTGHLVFTTIHANTALEVVDRMVNLGVHRDLVASALSVVGAQRLLRRVVPERWQWSNLTVADAERMLDITVAKDESERSRLFKARTLLPQYDHGDNSNYQGRIAVHQFQRFDDELKDAIRAGKGGRELYQMARKKGLRTMVEDALVKVQQGHISLEEVALSLRGA